MNNILKRFLRFQNTNRPFRRFYTPRRALLYVPGDDTKKIQKTNSLDVDCIAMDCEDGVAINKKNEARETIRGFLDSGKPKKARNFDWGVRVNSTDSNLCEEDLNYLLTAKNLPDTVLLPKVQHSDEIKWFSDKMQNLISGDNWVNLIIYIETAVAFIHLTEIVKTAVNMSKNSKFRPVSLVYGGDDFIASIGAIKTEENIETLYARQKLVLVAKAYNLQAIDMVFIKYKDLEGLKKQSEQGLHMGFTGKQVIHPGQVDIVQNAFLPTNSQVEWAIGLLKSFEEHQKTGKGAFTYQGSMIDMPTMKQAQNIVEIVNTVKK